jgi:hypothetical protein
MATIRDKMGHLGYAGPVLGHAIGISGDTERNVSGGGPVLVLDRCSEALKGRDSITSPPLGEKENFANVLPRVPVLAGLI